MKTFAILLLFLSINASGNESLPGGTGSTTDFSVQAFSHPLKGTKALDRREFTVGNSFFQGVWVEAPSSTDLRDGLGPVFNATSCAACHFKDGRGRGLPDEAGPVDISLLFRLRTMIPSDKKVLESFDNKNYGHQFNPSSIEGVRAEGEVHVSYEQILGKYADGSTYELKRPRYVFKNLAYGEFSPYDIKGPRVASQMAGLGLVENIPEEDILKNADPDDLNGDGISGKANYVYSVELKKNVLGRFGHKAGKPSLKEQSAAAFMGDIGITSSLFPVEDCSHLQLDCIKNRTKNDISDDLLNKVTSYAQLLSVPVRRNIDSKNVKNGQKQFKEMGCTACHIPHFKTGTNSRFAVLNNQDIYPYSDFLLHDMGKDLADHEVVAKTEGEATTYEFRTPPLWGIGLIKTVNGHTRLMHDGRARNVEEAILWHGGEGLASREKFKKLSIANRLDLIEFVNSL